MLQLCSHEKPHFNSQLLPFSSGTDDICCACGDQGIACGDQGMAITHTSRLSAISYRSQKPCPLPSASAAICLPAIISNCSSLFAFASRASRQRQAFLHIFCDLNSWHLPSIRHNASPSPQCAANERQKGFHAGRCHHPGIHGIMQASDGLVVPQKGTTCKASMKA